WPERIRLPLLNLRVRGWIFKQIFETLRAVFRLFVERHDAPEALRSWSGWVVRRVGCCRVEDVVEPLLRLFEALVLAQLRRDHERRVEEQLPVVERVSAAIGEVDILERYCTGIHLIFIS